MITFDHVAVLAGRRGRRLGERAVLLEQVAHPVLRGRPHLPLGVIEAHVAGLAGLGLTCLDRGKCMTGMAGVARGVAEERPLILQIVDVLDVFQTDLVAAGAGLHPRPRRQRQGVGGRHCLVGGPRRSVLAPAELFQPSGVASAAGGRGDRVDERGVARPAMVASVAIRAAHAGVRMSAELPIRHDGRRNEAVALLAGVGLFRVDCRRRHRQEQRCQQLDHFFLRIRVDS